MDHTILFSLIFMIESSFQDKVGNPYCNYKSGLETIEGFCCPRCKQDNNKEKCHYECPIDYYRFGKRCYGNTSKQYRTLNAFFTICVQSKVSKNALWNSS
ncbi:Hypothetical predicted protein [Mytilus galloprovincialis]|uniref:Uncharacterized protein n=1 Tax=Mytilus galloprovincialis TaxID=29158 RepID=A0A8B6FAI8_MYTGA|nr:Hypothetical predicted protein [Mytilus galloprovincialis]